jgi:glycosyltransferase involved in cell wall biosynthesis
MACFDTEKIYLRGKEMKVAIIGSTHIGYPPDEFVTVKKGEYAPNHSVSSATVGLARAFERAGFEVCMPGWNKVPDDVDCAFMCEHYMIQFMAKHGLWDFSKPTVFWGHIAAAAVTRDAMFMSGEEIMKKCAGVCFTRQEALDGWRVRYGKHRHEWIAPWAVPEWWQLPPQKPNPYKPEAKNVVYAGRIELSGHIDKFICAVAKALPDVNIHIISSFLDRNIWDNTLQAEKHADLADRLRSFSNIHIHGSMIHGTFLHYLYYADCALDTGIFPGRDANNCKIWDYLACGCPVVTDGRFGGDDLIEESGFGTVVPMHDLSAYVEAVKRWTERWHGEKKEDWTLAKRAAIQWMRNKHSWEATAAKWMPQFKQAVGAV